MTPADVTELILTIIKPLVTEPDQVKVQVVSDSHFLNFNVTVAPADMGRVIGKNGRVVSSIRTIVYGVHLSQPARMRLNIVE